MEKINIDVPQGDDCDIEFEEEGSNESNRETKTLKIGF